jgi:hypothetical protein
MLAAACRCASHSSSHGVRTQLPQHSIPGHRRCRPPFPACRPLLLLLKTNDCLRAVDSALGQPINTFVITARQCARALAEDRVKVAPGLGSRVAAAVEQLRIEAVIGALVLMTWWGRLRGAWRGQREEVQAQEVLA